VSLEHIPGVVRGARALEEPLAASVVTLGTFDGVHLGHQELIRRTVAAAARVKAPAIAYTFDPHPARVLAPKVAPRTLISVRERVRLMRRLGIERVIVEPFDRAFADLDADEWVEKYLIEKLRPRHVVVGFNFSYGRGRGGDPAHLQKYGAEHGFTVEIVEPVTVSTLVCSSTRVREFLLEGNVEGARMLLDRPFALTGLVIRGQERGRTIGVPTANLAPESELIPAAGVYATRVVIEPSDDPGAIDVMHGAVTNIGLRPTFDGSTLSIESHLLDFAGDLYGKRLRVELIARIRDEKRFPGPDALVAQIKQDIAEGRKLVSSLS
jgi:riboflavin kinase/FMN adenylyltransferase